MDEFRDVIALCADMSLTYDEIKFFGLIDDPHSIADGEDRYADSIIDRVNLTSNINKGGYAYV